MRLLITGGAGYVGSELVRHLAGNPTVTEIVVYDNLSRGNYNLFTGSRVPGDKVRFVRGDVLDSRKLRQIVRGVDVVCHLAAKVSTPFASQDPHLFEQTNHWGTAELVYAIEENPVSKLVYLSSMSVYGSGKDVIDEGSPTKTATFYGMSKLRGEEHVRRLGEKVPAFIVRCGNVYGFSPSMRFDSVINRFMFQANFENRITIQGGGTQKRAFVHIDKVSAVIEGLLGDEVPPGTYNLVDKNLPVLEVARTVESLYPGLEMLFINQHLELRSVDVDLAIRLRDHLEIPASDLADELRAFKNRFAFCGVEDPAAGPPSAPKRKKDPGSAER